MVGEIDDLNVPLVEKSFLLNALASSQYNASNISNDNQMKLLN